MVLNLYAPTIGVRCISKTEEGSDEQIRVLDVNFTSHSERSIKTAGEPLNFDDIFRASEFGIIKENMGKIFGS